MGRHDDARRAIRGGDDVTYTVVSVLAEQLDRIGVGAFEKAREVDRIHLAVLVSRDRESVQAAVAAHARERECVGERCDPYGLHRRVAGMACGGRRAEAYRGKPDPNPRLRFARLRNPA